ncbi:hypothetical protein ACTFIY_005065 [Dictyostelium cf. discoideum]
MKEKIIKAVIIGDAAVGKTSLLITKRSGFPLEYIPTIFDIHYFGIKINDQIIRIGCWDTGGGEDYPRIRPLSYPQTNLFLILFSISSRKSFNNCETYWLPEVTKFLPSVPIILVGTKTDLRNCDDYLDKSTFVTYEEGLEMKDKINASAYIECSALLNKGVDDLFDTMAIIGNNDLKSIIPNQLLRDHWKDYNQSQRSEFYEDQRNNYENNNNNNNNNKCIIC